jgi:MoaA/NifB/PqqE/SkfB family radical SAM enzyme
MFMSKNADGKIIHLLNDFVSCEDYCNLSCAYCLSEGADLKDNHDFKRVDGQLNFKHDNCNHKNLRYIDEYELKSKIDKTLEAHANNFDAPIFKISGGEVTLIDNLDELLRIQSEKYEVVQLLTNGLLLNEDLIKKLSQIKNINVQLSLDGHTYEMNKCRFRAEAAFKNVLNNLELLDKYNIDTEIYCVLSKVNIEYIESFCKYIKDKFGDKIQIIPFPVRLLGAKKFSPSPEQLQSLKNIIDNYNSYAAILPPRKYMEEMYDFIIDHERKTRCLVPKIMSQFFDDGVITPCPNCWTVNIGNIIDNMEAVKKNLNKHPMYRLMTSDIPQTLFCKQCFTDYHVYNLYLNNEITLEELIGNRKMLQGEAVIGRLEELKRIIDDI